MGCGSFSKLPNIPSNFPHFSLTFRYSDKIKLAFASDRVIQAVRQPILQFWTKGIAFEGICDDGSYEIKLNGTPFSRGSSLESALNSKRFCCAILSGLLSLGWVLITSSDLSRTTDHSTLFFERNCPENRPKNICCVSLSSSDKLQLVNAFYYNAPEQLITVFRQSVVSGYEGGIQEERQYGSDYELKLNGYPWRTSSLEECLSSRKLLLEIIRRFDGCGFQFYGTANLKGTADCMFFIYNDQRIQGECSYMMVSLNRNDRLRLIDCQQYIIDETRLLIEQYWPYGIQAQNMFNAAFEFKLGGTPWWADGQDTVSSRLLITMMLKKYLSLGWCVVTALDVSRRLNDKSVFIFKTCRPTSLAHFCISLNQTDKIRLINAPNDIIELVRQTLVCAWQLGIQEEERYFESYQFKLNGRPWSSGEFSGNVYLQARCMMSMLLKSLMERGWKVICSADVSAKYYSNDKGTQYPLDVHSWFVAADSIRTCTMDTQFKSSMNVQEYEDLPSYSTLYPLA